MSDSEPNETRVAGTQEIQELRDDELRQHSADDAELTISRPTAVTAVTQAIERVAPGDACLVIIHGQELGRRVALDSSPMVIGRSPGSTLHLDQGSVSRTHCEIRHDGVGFVVRDLGSTNGTWINDAPTAAAELRDGDHLRIGRTIFKYIVGDNVEAQYHEEIYKLVTTDGLTQLRNRRFFEEALQREVSRCRRHESDVSLVAFDVDHFKQINDEHGHLAGDAVLQQLGALVTEQIRRADVAARTGGEEFGLLAPEVPVDGAVELARKINRVVAENSFHFDDKTLSVTVSLGVAGWHPGLESGHDLLRAADEKLYEAKRAGRNRVCH